MLKVSLQRRSRLLQVRAASQARAAQVGDAADVEICGVRSLRARSRCNRCRSAAPSAFAKILMNSVPCVPRGVAAAAGAGAAGYSLALLLLVWLWRVCGEFFSSEQVFNIFLRFSAACCVQRRPGARLL